MNLSLLDIKFIGLMALVVLVRSVVPARRLTAFGAVASAALIGLASPVTLVVIVGLALGYLYPLAALIRYAKGRSGDKSTARPWLMLGITGLVGLMILFKVHRHFSLPWLSGDMIGDQVIALIGFSYFLFRAFNYLYMNYLVDIDEKGPVNLLIYVLFPPTITSGPIQKYLDFRQQLANPQPLNLANLATGVYRITRGYFRKICLAFFLNEAVEGVLATWSPTVYTSIVIIVLLYVYFYFDFAGYSDIAIGFGLLLGVRVPENFKQPFLATSITEFWRNWHITFADWFRDHVFIPLGGMRSGRVRAGQLAFLIMLLGGLWHGLTWPFLLWGVWHGTMLLLEAVAGLGPLPPSRRHGPKYWMKVFFTNARMAFGAVFFLPLESLSFVWGGFTQWW